MPPSEAKSVSPSVKGLVPHEYASSFHPGPALVASSTAYIASSSEEITDKESDDKSAPILYPPPLLMLRLKRASTC